MNRILWIDAIRAFAIFAVIVLHSASTFLYKFNQIDTREWQIANIYDSLVRMAVPLFFMLTGAIFLKIKDESTDIFFKKRFTKIIIPLLAWSFVYILFRKYALGENVNIIKDLFLSLFRKEYYHLWFLYYLIGLYLYIPILKVFIKNSSLGLQIYFVILFITASAIFPILIELRHIDIPNYLAMMQGYAGYLVLGFLLMQVKITKKVIFLALAFIAAGSLITIYGTYYLSLKSSAFNGFFYSGLSISTILQTCGWFILIKYISEEKVKKTSYISSFFIYLGITSFGIYLIHPIIMWVIEEKIGLPLSVAYYIPVLSIITLIISFVIVYFMQKIPLVKHMVP